MIRTQFPSQFQFIKSETSIFKAYINKKSAVWICKNSETKLLTCYFCLIIFFLQGAISESIRVWFSNQRYQNKRKLTKSGITDEPERYTKKKATLHIPEGDYQPPENDDLACQKHIKALEKEEKSRNSRQEVITKLMSETQIYREAEIRSIEGTKRVKDVMAKYKTYNIRQR